MKHRILASSMAVSLSLFAAQALQAQPLNITVPVHARLGKSKTISVHMRNETTQPVTVKGGDQQIVLQPGKEASLKVVEGTQLVSVNATPNHEAGGVFATANSDLSGTTVIIN